MRRLDGIEQLLGAVDVLARAGLLVLVDLGLAPVPSTCETEYVLSRIEAAVVDLERVAVERADRRAGGPVPLGVVLAAVARAAVAGGDRPDPW